MSQYPVDLFGIECGFGWNCLIEPLVRRCRREGVRIEQIKEKFGGLRFYTVACSDELQAAIDDAEGLSYTICEECGEPGKRRDGSWIRTLCDEHSRGGSR